MNLKELVDKVLYSGSNFARREGELIFKEGLVSNMKSKKIDSTYHIYGKVKNENKTMEFSSHIKINIENGTLLGCKCSSNECDENGKLASRYVCKHNLATIYMFYDLAKKKIPRGKENSENRGNSILKSLRNKSEVSNLNLDIKLKYVKDDSSNYYEAEFRVGRKNTNLINSLEEFINSRNTTVPITFNKEFTYKPSEDIFSKDDENVVTFIKEYAELNKVIKSGSYQITKGKVLRIVPNTLRRFLELIDSNKKIVFLLEYQMILL